MDKVLHHKVVVALPDPLEPDSIYYVRAGSGFDIHVTNGAGVVTAYSLNADLDLDGKVNSSDPRLSDAREWSSATVTQAESEAGTASTRRAWTSQRVRQAINAWWQLVTSGFGRSFIAATNEQAARNVLQLGTAATRNVGTAPGNVMPGEIGTIELNAHGSGDRVSFIDFHSAGAPYSQDFNARIIRSAGADGDLTIQNTGSGALRLFSHGSIRTSQNILIGFTGQNYVQHSGNILQTTGQSTILSMTQKAVTDAINARGFADASGVLTVTSGALSNDMSSFLSQTTKDTMRSNLEVPQLNASATAQGGLKARLDGTTLYITNDGSDA